MLTGKPTGRPFGRPKRGRQDNIRMDLKQVGVNTRNWIDWVQDGDYWRVLLNAALNLQVPQAMELVGLIL